ncbi:MAG: metalloregulator ArsR/SmtB family transcription factor [Gammaproteobacteria bacterium]
MRELSADEVTELAEMFRLLGEPNRLGIVLSCLERPVTVGSMAERLGLSPSLVSHHLRLLRATRLLRGERDGKHIRSMPGNMVEHLVEEERGDD